MIEFICQKCGNCCKQRFFCIYFTELKKFNLIKNKANKDFNLIPFRFFVDNSNKTIITIIYRSDSKPCPFLNKNNLCRIENDKFIACRKFPVATWLDIGILSKLGFNRLYFELDYHCTFLKENEEFIKAIKNVKLGDIFKKEIQANYEDHKIWIDINSKIRKFKKSKNFEIVIDYKFRKRKSNFLKSILNTWTHLPANEYFKKY
ncbi:MAG: YkgJ family cysteine cluster protein [Candidatus Helarchaeota archaeon]